MFLLGHYPFLAGQILAVVTLAIVNLDCTVILLQLKKQQLNLSRFGNKNYKLIVLLLFTAEEASHSVRGTVTQATTAIVRFTSHLAKSLN